MKHALALILACCALVAQDKPNSDDPGEVLRRAALGLESPAPSGKPNSFNSDQKRATELRRLLNEGKITHADLNRMYEEGKISAAVMLLMNVEDDAAPAPQAKPATKATKAAEAEAPKPAAVAMAAESKTKIPPIDVRDELIELIYQLKKEANESPSSLWGKVSSGNEVIASLAIAEYEAKAKAKTEAQRLLLQALVELAKETGKEKPTKAWHSSLPPPAKVFDPFGDK
jgi:hypothetical protein